LFIKNFLVPFDKNQVERDIRMLKVIGCFSTMEGAKDYALIRSYLSSAKKHGVNVYKAIELALAGNAEKAIWIEATE